MKRLKLTKGLVPSLLFCVCLNGFAAGETKLLWQIGKANNDTDEFLLAPSGYAKFTRDGFFVVGQSNPKREWPYVHPGPRDGWAGG